MVYDSGKGEIFVSSGTPSGEGETPTVTVISDTTNAVLTTITSRSWWTPMGMAYDSGKGEIFLTDAGNKGNVMGAVYVISDSDNSIVTSIQVGSYPAQAVYDSGMNEIFVVNTRGTVSVISDSTNTVVATINVGAYPYGIAYDSAKGEVFVYNENDGSVSVISDSTNAVVQTITGVAASTNSPYTIAFDSSKGELFVSDSVISVDTNTITAHLPTGLGNMVYNSGKGEIIGSTPTGLSVFSDTSTPAPTSTATASPTASPTVPEFSNAMLSTILAAMAVVAICTIAVSKRKNKINNC
jgi:YVTN family beta-propeller protein